MANDTRIRRVAAFRTLDDFREHLQQVGASLPTDADLIVGEDAPLAQPVAYRDRSIGNRFCVLPMEGWDGTTDGRPTEYVRRRWAHFGASGAKLIWGCEATAVRPDGRANPNQLMINERTLPELTELRAHLVDTHKHCFGTSDDLYVGLQLTHSGRFSRPNDKRRLEPKILYHHPILDARFGIDPDLPVMTDGEIEGLVGEFVNAAVLAQRSGFDFVDVKHCHGYLGHEFLSARTRPGAYGGSLENRTRFLREIVSGIRSDAPGLDIGVRFSAFDFVPFEPSGDERRGAPALRDHEYAYAFGGDGSGTGIDLAEPLAFLDVLSELDISLVCVTGGSPYYNPHIQRPALFPPSDGYQPPEDPLVGVARQIQVTAALKRQRPGLLFVGSGYSYLQEWLPIVAQAVVRTRASDFVGVGRMVLSYPELPADILAGRPLARKRICRTFSDCTTGPRNGLISGCYPLDDFYHELPEYEQLAQLKRAE
ncbi:MAG: NADH:flavin oxidoreductase [Caldilineaceae bacterium]